MNQFGIRGLAALVGGGVLLASSAVFAAPSANGVAHRAVCPGPASKEHARCHARVVVDPDGKPTTNQTPAGYGPSDLRSAYSVTASGSASTTIAIVDAYGYPNAETDLAKYRSQFGLPACTTAGSRARTAGPRSLPTRTATMKCSARVAAWPTRPAAMSATSAAIRSG